MQIGKGYDSISNEARGSAVYLEQKVLLVTDDTSALTEAQQKSKVKRYPYSPGNYRLRSFESLDELTKLISGSLGLAAKLPQLGLSLDVSASKSDRVDANFIYYLLELKSGEFADLPVSVPELSDFAKQTLGLSTPAIRSKELEITAKEADLKKKLADLAASPTAVSDAEKLQKPAQDAYDTAKAENDALVAIFASTKPMDLSKDEIKAQSDSIIRLFKATQDLNAAKDKLAQAKKNQTDLPAAVTAIRHDLTTLEGELQVLKDTAAAGVNDEKMKEFYKRFGTHFVNKVSYGRQFVALITIDRNSISHQKNFKGSAGVSSQYVTVKGSLERDISQLATQGLVKIDIACDGILTSAMPSPQNMKELQAAIADFTSHDHQTTEAALIDFELESYANVLSAAGVKSAQIKYLLDRIDYAESVCNHLHELRSSAIRCYATRYFHELSGGGAQANSLLGDAITLEKDPHNRRLQYVYDHLSTIIYYLNGLIDKIHGDAFVNIPGVLEADVANNIDPPKVEAQLDLIRAELEERAGYKLLHVAYQDLTNTRDFAETSFRAAIPALATRVHISTFDGPSEQQNAPIAIDPVVATTAGPLAVRQFRPASVEADHALGWNFNDFKISLSEYLSGKILTATAASHSVNIPPEIKRDEGLQFSLKKWHARPAVVGTHQATVRFFAAVTDGRLNLDGVSQDNMNLMTRAIEAKTLPDVIAEEGRKTTCVMM